MRTKPCMSNERLSTEGSSPRMIDARTSTSPRYSPAYPSKPATGTSSSSGWMSGESQPAQNGSSRAECAAFRTSPLCPRVRPNDRSGSREPDAERGAEGRSVEEQDDACGTQLVQEEQRDEDGGGRGLDEARDPPRKPQQQRRSGGAAGVSPR